MIFIIDADLKSNMYTVTKYIKSKTDAKCLIDERDTEQVQKRIEQYLALNRLTDLDYDVLKGYVEIKHNAFLLYDIKQHLIKE